MYFLNIIYLFSFLQLSSWVFSITKNNPSCALKFLFHSTFCIFVLSNFLALERREECERKTEKKFRFSFSFERPRTPTIPYPSPQHIVWVLRLRLSGSIVSPDAERDPNGTHSWLPEQRSQQVALRERNGYVSLLLCSKVSLRYNGVLQYLSDTTQGALQTVNP